MYSRILEMAQSGLESLRRGEVKYYDWRIRREVYKLLNLESTTVPDRRHQALAIQAAELVQPWFVPRWEGDQIVYRLLECARAFHEQRVIDMEELLRIEDEGYHDGQFFGGDPDGDEYNPQAFFTGFAAYKALVEVRLLIDPWRDIEHLSKQPNATMAGPDETSGSMISGEDFTDADWSSLAAFGDTASAACFAYACPPESNRADRNRLIEFWEWWVQTALPKAFALES